ncbi:MAG TPA: FN3 associated domain-containing protein [Spirochaetota bacterium]|nr:FN3 associated domain-containing protein [Spirochaetota bacterium]
MRIFLKISLMILAVSGVTPLLADDDIDGPQKTIVFRFEDVSARKAADVKNLEPFTFLSKILPDNLKREISESGTFAAETSDETPSYSSEKNEAVLIPAMKLAAENAKAEFVVAGSYSVIKKTLAIECVIYAYKANKLMRVDLTSEKLGAFLDKTLAELSGKIAAEMDRYVIRRTGTPTVLPAENTYELYQEITIVPQKEGDEIWYTLNGDEPVRGKSKRYTEPFRLRRKAMIKVIGYREGLYVSKVAVREIMIYRPLSRFIVGAGMGSVRFLGKWSDKLNDETGDGNWYYGTFELANFNSFRNNPLLNRMGLNVEYFSFRVHASEEGGMEFTGYARSCLAGLTVSDMYADFVSTEFGLMGGYFRTNYLPGKDDGNGWKDLFAIPASKGEQDSGPAFSARGRMSFIWGSFFVHIDAMYARLYLENSPMNTLTFGGGLGVRF